MCVGVASSLSRVHPKAAAAEKLRGARTARSGSGRPCAAK
eukprot:gene39981-35754_t